MAGRRSDVEVRPKLTSIDVHGLLFRTGQVDVTAVVGVFDALSQNRVGHLDDQAVQEHLGEQEGGGWRRILANMALDKLKGWADSLADQARVVEHALPQVYEPVGIDEFGQDDDTILSKSFDSGLYHSG